MATSRLRQWPFDTAARRLFGGRIGRNPGHWLRFLLTCQGRAMERAHLRELDRRLLDDMGLKPAQARAEAAKAFWLA